MLFITLSTVSSQNLQRYSPAVLSIHTLKPANARSVQFNASITYIISISKNLNMQKLSEITSETLAFTVFIIVDTHKRNIS
jgi:hypothetical protein